MMDVLGFDSRWLFTAVFAAEGTERLVELWLSRRNAARTLARGGEEHGHGINWLVIVLHVLWLAAAFAEVWVLGRPFIPWLGAICGAVLVVAMALRIWAMLSLGDRWNIRVITVPGEAPVRRGAYRWFRHPNYVGLYLELLALPMLHTAWLTALVLGVPHAAAVWSKSRTEDRVLKERS